MREIKFRAWLEFPFAGAEPAEIEVTSNLTGSALEAELRDVIMSEANIEWGYEKIDQSLQKNSNDPSRTV